MFFPNMIIYIDNEYLKSRSVVHDTALQSTPLSVEASSTQRTPPDLPRPPPYPTVAKFFDIGGKIEVTIMEVTSPSLFYVHRTDRDDYKGNLEAIIKDMTEYYEKKPPPKGFT